MGRLSSASAHAARSSFSKKKTTLADTVPVSAARSSTRSMQRDAKGNLRTRSHSTNSLTELGKRRATGVDSWAYGMLLWAIVHRRRPFEGWKTDDVISHIFETQDAEQLPLELCDPPPPPVTHPPPTLCVCPPERAVRGTQGREDGRPAEAKGTFCR